MNSFEIQQLIEQEIATTGSSNQKIQLIKKHADDDQFRRVLLAAYDPLTTYGIQQITMPSHHHDGFFSEATWQLLDDLAARRLTGHAAQEALIREQVLLDSFSAELLRRIVKKDLRAGISEGLINKAIPGLIPEFPYMRCSLPKAVKLNQWPWDEGIISQEKADGMFTNLNVENDRSITMLTRQGTPIPLGEFSELVAEAQRLLTNNYQYHGELLVEDAVGIMPREIGNGVLNSVIKGGKFEPGQRPILKLWDRVPLVFIQPKSEHRETYVTRLLKLQNETGLSDSYNAIHCIESQVVYSLEQAYEHYASMLAAGKEGTIIKHPDAIWRDGTSKQQVKLKLEVDVELEVIGLEPGKGKNAATFGSLICRSACGALQVSVAGISDKLRNIIHNNWDDWNRSIITVRANQIMKPSSEGKLHSLFLPRFVERRLDKRVADSLERIQEQFDNAIKVGA